MERPFAYVTRGGIVESVHSGVIAVVSSEGKLLGEYGDSNLVTFARSACKPLQAIPLVESGAMEAFAFEEADLALFCASHSSEAQHTERVERILARIGLDESYLQCGAHIPHSMQTYDRLVQAGKTLSSLYSNCSGKHSGMLAYAKHVGADVATYHHVEHPLQQAILQVVSDLTEVLKDDIVIGVDGCGVPVHALPVQNWARAYAKFADPERFGHGEAMHRISTAMRAYPSLVGGTDRFDTDLMTATHGRILAKGGAEGFMMVVVPKQRVGIALKVRDGNARAIPPIVIHTLDGLGALSPSELESLHKYQKPEVKNTRGEVVGEVVADFELALR
ncbi:asparaginase [Alicyclobacillus fastidiosus]|uniref:Asparaginase n=1 Tax=Alicyclobacillus fastidiosus TaxID=392011 RepID=A0ABY6ZG85_9BACL|nr:asparaginase [Alicyclobacillus fastidiosus]WAH41096.1 asparaginase [Alicyclobacillus fastidiosus]GMA62652.1 asparaginase [Alicyclobacillus fastidiosus]